MKSQEIRKVMGSHNFDHRVPGGDHWEAAVARKVGVQFHLRVGPVQGLRADELFQETDDIQRKVGNERLWELNDREDRFDSGRFVLCYRRSRKWLLRRVNDHVKNALAEDLLQRIPQKRVELGDEIPTVAKRPQERLVVADTGSPVVGKLAQEF